MTKQRKKKFEVESGETIEQCLDRMKKEGYQPMRRLEKPIFEERTERSTKEYVPVRQKIVFEGVLTENEQ